MEKKKGRSRTMRVADGDMPNIEYDEDILTLCNSSLGFGSALNSREPRSPLRGRLLNYTQPHDIFSDSM